MRDQDEHDAGAAGESLREELLHDFLVRGEIVEALREAESWTSWPLDDIGLWLLVEAYFQSRRPECAPILDRMLRNKGERDELSVKRMEEMLEAVKEWGS